MVYVWITVITCGILFRPYICIHNLYLFLFRDTIDLKSSRISMCSETPTDAKSYLNWCSLLKTTSRPHIPFFFPPPTFTCHDFPGVQTVARLSDSYQSVVKPVEASRLCAVYRAVMAYSAVQISTAKLQQAVYTLLTGSKKKKKKE